MVDFALIAVFCIAYLCITLESILKINKAAPALFAAAVSWCIIAVTTPSHEATKLLAEHTADTAGIIFFIMGAMTIVEVIDSRGGFLTVKRLFHGKGFTSITWILGIVTFFLSSVLDNMTTAIVMSSVVIKIAEEAKPRMLLAGLVIIAANAGGAWSPIGDVTTTMLWVDNRITSLGIIRALFLPSIVSTLIPIVLIAYLLKKEKLPIHSIENDKEKSNGAILFWGITLLVAVPVLKTIFHVPPFLAMIASLGILWIVSDFVYRSEHEHELRPVAAALKNIDLSSVMFFLGILLTVAALDSVGILRNVATGIEQFVPDERVVAIIIGVVSAIVDNVPLVAGAIGMYDPSQFPTDHRFWEYLAYCAGTGGSMLVIGSAAGVATMGIAKLEFGWYARVIGPIALAGYIGGVVVLYLMGV